MKNWKAIMSVSLALALPAGNLCAYSMPVLADEKSVPLSVEEYTLIESDFLAFEKDRKVANEDEAKELIRSLDLNLDPDAFDFVREIEDPAGNNYRYESGWLYSPDYMAEDIWYLSLAETNLTSILNADGYPAGVYRVAFYVDGLLADEFSFELK